MLAGHNVRPGYNEGYSAGQYPSVRTHAPKDCQQAVRSRNTGEPRASCDQRSRLMTRAPCSHLDPPAPPQLLSPAAPSPPEHAHPPTTREPPAAVCCTHATPRPSTTGPLHQRALHLPLRPTPRLPTDGPTAVTPTDCIAHLNVTPNLALLPHFLPTSQITISNVSDHRQLCCLLHPIRTDPRSHHITFRPSPQRRTTT